MRCTTLINYKPAALVRLASICLLVVPIALPVLAETLQGRVIGVSDGDTITVLDTTNHERKIRLAGIDAPEKSQAFGARSKQNLSSLTFGKTVVVDWNKTDKYGRTIGKVIANGQDANLSQIKAGLAWHYKDYEKEQSAIDRKEYANAEIAARAQRLGLWLDAKPVPPWDFRHGTGEASPEARIEKGETCPCGGSLSCTGPRGGHYCFTAGGKKKYQ